MKKQSEQARERPPWYGFVSCDLSTQRKEQFKAWSSGIETLEDYVSYLVQPGYKLSFSIDTYHDCLQVSWSCSAKGDPNEGWTLTARANELSKALAVLLFKHQVMLEGLWDSGLPSDQRQDDVG